MLVPGGPLSLLLINFFIPSSMICTKMKNGVNNTIIFILHYINTLIAAFCTQQDNIQYYNYRITTSALKTDES